jgi:hypothetical protein
MSRNHSPYCSTENLPAVIIKPVSGSSTSCISLPINQDYCKEEKKQPIRRSLKKINMKEREDIFRDFNESKVDHNKNNNSIKTNFKSKKLRETLSELLKSQNKVVGLSRANRISSSQTEQPK